MPVYKTLMDSPYMRKVILFQTA